MRLCISVGTLLGKYQVRVRRCEDGSIHILVNGEGYNAVFKRVQTGVCIVDSNLPDDLYRECLSALEMNLTYIDRRCIELTEAEMRIPYILVATDDGNKVSVGQSNSLVIYIVVENRDSRAIFQYTPESIKSIRSTYPKDKAEYVHNIVLHNLDKIIEVMQEKNMIETKGVYRQKLYRDSFANKMTEEGKLERQKVDNLIEMIFSDLDNRGFSNLEIQSMLLESVFEVSLRHRGNKT